MNVLLMHGCAVAVKDEAYMIIAESGVGKTTRARLWLKYIKESYIVNGDKPLIKFSSDGVFVCGTPWCGKERVNRNRIVPLKAICVLQRSEINELIPLSFSEAFPYLHKQKYRFNDKEKQIK